MAITNQERVGKAMDLLRAGLSPFVERGGGREARAAGRVAWGRGEGGATRSAAAPTATRDAARGSRPQHAGAGRGRNQSGGSPPCRADENSGRGFPPKSGRCTSEKG